ncbi:MAG: hypothetical protein WA030_01895 [Candidatus Microsaccharimonas sp.]
MTVISVELFAAHDFYPPVDVIKICAEELFPVIFASIDTKNPPASTDFIVDEKVNTNQDLGKKDLVVTITGEGNTIPKQFATHYASDVEDALVEALGGEVKIGVEIFRAKYTRIGGSSTKLKRLPMQENDRFTSALAKMDLRILAEDDRIQVDTDTGAISVLTELDAGLPSAASVLGEINDPKSAVAL